MPCLPLEGCALAALAPLLPYRSSPEPALAPSLPVRKVRFDDFPFFSRHKTEIDFLPLFLLLALTR